MCSTKQRKKQSVKAIQMLNKKVSPNGRLLLTRAAIPVMLTLIAILALRSCDKKKIEEINNEQLKPGEKAAIIIGSNSRSLVSITNRVSNGSALRSALLRGRNLKPSSDTSTIIERIDGARGIRFSISNTGAVSATARTRGLCFEPGFGVYSTTSDSRIFIDTQLVFTRRHGINAGVGLGLRGRLRPAAFVAYSYNFWSNTSLLVGYDTKHEALLGLRVQF